MRDFLTKYGISTDTLSAAVNSINAADDSVTKAFVAEFGMTLSGDDSRSAARFAADAILRGANSSDKVVGFVRKRIAGLSVANLTFTAPVAASAPVAVVEEVEDVPVVTVTEDTTVPLVTVEVKRGRGRPRLENNDVAKAVAIIESMAGSKLVEQRRAIIAAGIHKSSANVYLWKYHHGKLAV
jgi:hypothetical protein